MFKWGQPDFMLNNLYSSFHLRVILCLDRIRYCPDPMILTFVLLESLQQLLVFSSSPSSSTLFVSPLRKEIFDLLFKWGQPDLMHNSVCSTLHLLVILRLDHFLN